MYFILCDILPYFLIIWMAAALNVAATQDVQVTGSLHRRPAEIHSQAASCKTTQLCICYKTGENRFCSENDSTFLPAGQFSQLLSFFPASGKNSGEPYLSTPNVLITFCASAETIKSAKAFAPEAFTLGHLAGFTSIT